MKKNAKKITKRIICLFVCFLTIFACVLPCAAAHNLRTTVKAGFYAFDGYHMKDKDGNRFGYGYEILQHMAGYANFKYEYVGYNKNWNDMLDMLENGEIDILTGAQKTEDCIKRFDFSDLSIGTSSAILSVKSGDTKYILDNYANWSGMRIGLVKGSSQNISLDSFAAAHGFTYTPVFFETTEQMLAELKKSSKSKKIDAVLTSNLRHTEKEWIIAKFDISPFYIMVRKGNSKLLEQINTSLEQLDSNDPGFRTKLMNKYYKPSDDEEIAFSLKERAYINKMKDKTFTAVINPDCAPYSYLDNGKFKGIIYDLAQKLIKMSNLNVKFVDVKNRKQYWQMIEEGKVDLRFDVSYSLNQAEKDGYLLTEPYITVPISKLYRKNTKTFKNAASPINRDIREEFVKEKAKNGKSMTYYNSVDDVIDAIATGKQDVAYLGADTAIMAVKNNVANQLVCDDIFGDDGSFSVGVNGAQDPLLFSIFNKVVLNFDEKEINTIRQDYSSDTDIPFSVVAYFYDYPMRFLIVGAATLFFVVLIIIIFYLIKHRITELANLKKEQERNDILKDALAIAEKADAAKSQFLSRVSHEMRTPLNAIIGFLELAKGSDAKATANYLVSSNVAAKQLLSVINDVLDMSSIESGKLKIAHVPFNFKNLITSITNIYGMQCKQKGIIFETKITTPIEDWLIGDELRINQILMNILGNSVKFTSNGHIWLTISETTSDKDKVFLRFEISDTGCGMSDEMLERLFKPFEQESATTARKYGGSGLGLSIVKNLVSMMDGSIRVESKQNEGSTFVIDMPFTKSETEQGITQLKNVNNLRILAVDDEKNELKYISLVLERMGVRYTCVCSGSDALDELDKAQKENDPYNVCLIDWRMPELNGFDTTKKIRKIYGRDVVVIVVSAYDFQQAGDKARDAGANMFVSKPLFQSSLFDLLMTLTGGEIAASKKGNKALDFSGKRVLLVEDNTLNQIVAKGFLDKYNITCDIANNGQAAVDKFASSKKGYYDAILMDIQMPVMNGLDATKAIRKSSHPDAKTIYIIAQTADAFNEDISKALSNGMNAHLAKPIDPQLLAETLDKAFTDKNINI